MPRPRLTPEQARVMGADKRSPGRFKDRADPSTEPLGSPPQGLSAPVKEAWLELASDIPWLCRSDRHLLKLTAELAVATRRPDAPIAAYAQLRLCLSSLAATPTDRSKVSIPDDENEDPAAEFFN